MSALKKFSKLATEFVEYMAKPSKKTAGEDRAAGRTKPGSRASAKRSASGRPEAAARDRRAAGSGATKGAAPGAAEDRSRSAGDTSGPLEVSYAPDMDGDPDPGEVVWTYVSYEDDPSQGKDRPVAVIGWDGPVLGVVQLTSRHKDREDHVAIGTGAWDRERRPSFAKIDRILRVQPSEVRREGAVLAEDRFTHLVKELRALHGWPLDTNDDA
ncbi:MAG: type II toxin-antitoxin system PemK/MazF family toxin [Microthrixaceae bacterium]